MALERRGRGLVEGLLHKHRAGSPRAVSQEWCSEVKPERA